MSASGKRSALKHWSSHGSSGSTSSATATATATASSNEPDMDSSSELATASPGATTRPTNDGAQDTITVFAHVREKIIAVHCGFGTQQVVWLGHVAIARYDDTDAEHQGWLALGTPTAVAKASSSSSKRDALRLTDLICDVLADGTHVYIETSLGGY